MKRRKNDPLENLDKYPCNRRHRRRTLRVMVDYVAEGRPCCEYATTLGAGGMFIRSDNPLPKGSMLKIRFRLPTEEESPLLEMDARVAWSQTPVEDDSTRDPGMGIEFTDKLAVAELGRMLLKIP